MDTPSPITLEGHGVRLEPLTREHHDGLVAAAQDGELWKLWFTSVPEPDQAHAYISAALAGQEAGHMLPWAVRELATGLIAGSTRYHDIVPAAGPRRDRLHVVRAPLAEEPRQHGLQAAAARPRVRRARLRRRRPAHRQLQLRLAAGDRGARREEGRRAPPPRAAPRRHRARHRDVQHPGRRVARREAPPRDAARAARAERI